jgi:hypothetical protein
LGGGTVARRCGGWRRLGGGAAIIPRPRGKTRQQKNGLRRSRRPGWAAARRHTWRGDCPDPSGNKRTACVAPSPDGLQWHDGTRVARIIPDPGGDTGTASRRSDAPRDARSLMARFRVRRGRQAPARRPGLRCDARHCGALLWISLWRKCVPVVGYRVFLHKIFVAPRRYALPRRAGDLIISLGSRCSGTVLRSQDASAQTRRWRGGSPRPAAGIGGRPLAKGQAPFGRRVCARASKRKRRGTGNTLNGKSGLRYEGFVAGVAVSQEPSSGRRPRKGCPH